ncbi:hypothetical protein [Asinibacterium sp. OR53]|uniref:hypothetical protein n=1 Tax=Asinibacterium sp. OR53 TaxID=925409 RepID=UPI0004793B77|nr:hypothetical protein [Asinibacterium sp. OR53]
MTESERFKAMNDQQKMEYLRFNQVFTNIYLLQTQLDSLISYLSQKMQNFDLDEFDDYTSKFCERHLAADNGKRIATMCSMLRF